MSARSHTRLRRNRARRARRRLLATAHRRAVLAQRAGNLNARSPYNTPASHRDGRWIALNPNTNPNPDN